MDTALGHRLQATRNALAAAARRSGREAGSVRLVVVTKAAPPSIFDQLAAAGVRDVGESRVRDAAVRMQGFERLFRWHLVGHLQGNKARLALELFDVFHGVDSLALLERLERLADELGRRPELLLQVNVSAERRKSGFAIEQLPDALDRARELRCARVIGLMTMAPLVSDPEQARPVFRALAALRQRHAGWLPELSMGMTDDFEVAIEEGATFVRIGRRIVAPPSMT